MGTAGPSAHRPSCLSAERLGLAAVGYGAVVGPAVDTAGHGLELLDDALAAIGLADSPARALALSRLAKWRYHAGRDVEGRSVSREAIDMACRIGDAPLVDAVLSNVRGRSTAPTTSESGSRCPPRCWRSGSTGAT